MFRKLRLRQKNDFLINKSVFEHMNIAKKDIQSVNLRKTFCYNSDELLLIY